MPEPTATAAARKPDPTASPHPPHLVAVQVKVWVAALALEEPGGGFSVVVPALPGCVTQGETIEEVQANIVEAAEGWLAVAHDRQRDQALRDMLP